VLSSRTLRLVHREAEASMIATQWLLCQGALAMPAPCKGSLPVMCSARGVLLEIRRDMAGRSKRGKPFTDEIGLVRCERILLYHANKTIDGACDILYTRVCMSPYRV
jgi:hypothetical protein